VKERFDVAHAMDMRGLRVHFLIRDITFPAPEAVLRALHEDDIVAGRVVDVSDSGASEAAFLVVKLDGLEQPVVVPVANICDWRQN
jgi:5-keto 4-deoxyuronate isomerase